MRLAIVASPRAEHQTSTAQALAKGLALQGDETIIFASGEVAYHELERSVPVCVWGWRRGMHFRQAGHDVLVMERAYVEDRFRWISLGWNGLNGRAQWPEISDGGERWQRFFPHLLRPWRFKSAAEARRGARRVLLIGQVPSDTAVKGSGCEFVPWAETIATELMRKGWIVSFRPHPGAPHVRISAVVTRPSSELLEDALSGLAFTVSYNSNASVDSVLAGVPAVSLDRGSTAWAVSSHDLDDPIAMPDRSTWCASLAWRQWLPEELEDGSAWAAVRAARWPQLNDKTKQRARGRTAG